MIRGWVSTYHRNDMLAGRAEHLRILEDALNAAIAGRGSVIVISGEAGIGKSTLAEALATHAELLGVTITRGRAWEFADAPPYFPVRPCLRALALDDRVNAGDAFALWESVISELARTSRVTPALWIVEDVHAADLGTLDLLAFLAQPLRAMRALVVVTVRANDPRLGPRVAQRIARMERDGVVMRLEPLANDDVAALAESTLGATLSEAARTRLVQLTGGNPLFVIECARVFRKAGGAEGTIDALPVTVRQVILERVDALPETTRATLACGAVLGREFSAAAAARMLDTLPARAIDTLLPALRAGIVTEPAPGRFLFSHGIVRDAIESALTTHERAVQHARAESALAATSSGADAIEVLVERARHAIEALPESDPARVGELVRRASKMLEAERGFERAFEIRMRLDVARESGMYPAAASAERLELAVLARAAGRSDIMRRECERLFSMARAAADTETFARAALLNASDVRPGVVDHAQVERLEEALRLLEQQDVGALRCRVRARYATARQPSPDQPAVIAIAETALAEARAAGDEQALRDVLEQMPWGLYAAPLARRIVLMEELRDRALRASDSSQALRAHAAIALYRVEGADFQAFERETDATLELSRQAGHPRDRWRPLLLASMRALSIGDFSTSDRHVTELGQLAGLVDDTAFPLAFATHEALRKRLQRCDGDAKEALAAVEARGADLVEPAMQMAVLRAACAARAEDVDGVRRALAMLGDRSPLVWVDPNFLALLAEPYALVAGDADRRAMRETLHALQGDEVAADPVSYVYEGTTARLLGLLDASLGDLDEAERQLGIAHAQARERGHGPWIAQTAYELARLAERAARPHDARTWAAQARDVARDLGMSDLARAAETMLGEARAERPPAITPERASFRLERRGNEWTVGHGLRTVVVKHTRGMQLLARLVERPEEEIHVLALASDEGASAPSSDAGDHLDAQAVTDYRRRVADLDEEIAEAERMADTGRLAKRREEREALLAELSRAIGLGGRRRAAASASERARVNVQRRLKDAFLRIGEADPVVGRFFERAVRTGTFCCFRP
jgi:hypothetical protein